MNGFIKTKIKRRTNIKKLLAVLFALIFVLFCFAGCGDKKEDDTTKAADSGEVEKEDNDAEDEAEDEEETTKKKSADGFETAEELAEAYFRAAYVDQDADAIRALVNGELVEDLYNCVIAEEGDPSYAETKKEARDTLKNILESFKEDYESNDMDTDKLDYELYVDKVDAEAIANTNETIEDMTGNDWNMTDACELEMTILYDGNDYASDNVDAICANGVWYLIMPL